jgi:hypothetical protein
MMFVGFMDESKSIQYYNAKTCSIKVSKNVAFNENDKPKELEDFVKIPGLQAEGENFEGPPLQTEPENQSIPPKIPTTPPEILLQQSETPELPRLHPKTNPIDYRKMDNPKFRLSSLYITFQSLTPTSDVTRPTKASKTKNKTQDQANFALENLYKKILENLECSFSISNQDNPKTIEALSRSDAEKWKEVMETKMRTIAKMRTYIEIR